MELNVKSFYCYFSLLLALSLPVFAEEPEAKADTSELANRTEEIKKQVVELNRDLFLLEEDLLHPASTRLSVYVSMDYGVFFSLESVRIQLDGKPVTAFLYTDKDVSALKRGAIQPLFMGSIATGEHELVAIFTGMGPRNTPYKRAISLDFEKQTGEKAFEIQVVDSSHKLQPEFVVKQWK
ncbi:MAG TPA: AraC family transcriptional regulator [Aeromonadales bacterium]|nr:AraC family transcriptional regulator [Aeromonadales bacterium]